MAFDPDAYLAQSAPNSAPVAPSGFDPDAYLAEARKRPMAPEKRQSKLRPAEKFLADEYPKAFRFYTGARGTMDALSQVAERVAPELTQKGDEFDQALYEKTGGVLGQPAPAAEMRQERKETAAALDEDGGTDWYQTAGAVADPAAWALGSKVFQGATGLVKNAPRVVQRFAPSMATGAVVAPAVTQTAEDTDSFWADKAIQSGVGALTGAVFPALGYGAEGVGNLARTIKSHLSATPKEKANKVVQEMAKRFGLTPEQVSQKLDDLGEQATLADVDENFLLEARDIVNRLGPAKQAARDMVNKRQLGQHRDILDSFRAELGDIGADNIDDAIVKLGQRRKAEAGPLYKQAFDSELNKDLLKNPALRKIPNIQKVLKDASEIAKTDPDRVITGPNGEAIVRPLRPVERLHYAKKALWDQAQALKRSGQNEAGANVDKQRKIIDEVLNSVPEYKQARTLWSDSLSEEGAAEIGRSVLNTRVRPRDFSSQLAEMSEAERAMAKLAAFDEVANKIGGTSDTRAVSGLLTNNANIRDKVKALFGSEKAFNDFSKRVSKWDAFNRTRSVITGGSPTKMQQQTGIDAGEIMQTALTPKLAALRLIKEKLTGINPEVQQEVANILMQQGQNPAAVRNALTARAPIRIESAGRNAMTVPAAITAGRATE